MEALANSCAVSLPHEPASGKGSVRRMPAKLQTCFAEAAALVAGKEGKRAHKKGKDKPVTGLEAAGTPEAQGTRSRKQRSAGEGGQVVMAIPVPDQPVDRPIPVKKGSAKAERAAVPSDPVPAATPHPGKARPAEAADNTPNAVAGGPSGIGPVPQSQSARVSGNRKAEPEGTQVHVVSDPPASLRDKAEVKAGSPVPVNPNAPSAPKPQGGAEQVAASAPQPQVQDAETKEQGADAGRSAPASEHPRRETAAVAAPAGTGMAPAPQPVSRDPSAVVVEKAPVMSDSPVTRSEPESAVALPKQPKRGISPSRAEGPQQAAVRRVDIPTRERRQIEVPGSTSPKAESAPYPDGTSVPGPLPVSSIGPSLASTPQAPVDPGSYATMNSAASPSPVRTVGQQILDSVQASMAHGDREIAVRLQPPELGTITVRVREQDDHLEGTVEVGQSDTRREIERALPEVVRGLQEAGIQIRRLEVTGGDSPGQDLGRGLLQQDGWSGHNSSGQNRDHLPTPHSPWSQEAASYSVPARGSAETDRSTHVPAGRIDLLL